ncbi:MAG: asparagine synthase (glutamine-hydrolyzing) [Candidatus Eisenbacteria bacterium]
MCGICGILARRPSPEEKTFLRAMNETLLHRGPDGAGLFADPESGAFLGHTRLAIIDLSDAAAQPMSDETGGLRLVCNGEIYNHRELRRELEGRGHRFRSGSDSEVILHLYEEEGPDLTKRLDGIFAFALWDRREGRMFLARDPLGVKPLYYLEKNGRFLFGSSPKAILAHPEVTAEASVEGIWHYLTFNCAPAPHTLFKGIRKLPAGSRLVANGKGAARVEPYWDLPSKAPDPPDGNDVRSLRELFRRATEKRMMADVPVGAFLSGGVDSTINVGVMVPLSGPRLRTFALGYERAAVNELPFARLAADRFGTDHEELVVGEGDLEEALDPWMEHMDDPVGAPSVLSGFLLARRAREAAVPVVQVGEGADELFFGYGPNRRALRVHSLLWRHYERLPLVLRRAAYAALRRPLAGLGDPTLEHSLDGTFRECLRRSASGRPVGWGFANVFSDSAKEGLFSNPEHRRDSFTPLEPFFERIAAEGWDLARSLTYLDLKVGLAERLLMRVDKTNMAFAVEARVPFLDRALAEFAFHLPLGRLLPGGGKAILREAFGDLLPPEIRERKKMGFPTPASVFLGPRLLPLVEERVRRSSLMERGLLVKERVDGLFLRFRAGAEANLYPIWTLFVLGLWHDRWIAGRRGS